MEDVGCKKEEQKRRAMEGMIVGIKKELTEQEKMKEEGIIEGRIKYGKEKLRVVEECEWEYGKETRTVRKMDRGEKREDKNWGDFNARTDVEGGKVGLKGGDEERLERRSMDKKMNKEGKRLIEYIKERR